MTASRLHRRLAILVVSAALAVPQALAVAFPDVLDGLAGDTCSAGGPGGGDARIDPGEAVDLTVRLVNQGNTQANRIRIIVAARDAGVTVLADTADVPDIEPGDVGATVTPIRFTLDRLTACGAPLVFDVTIGYNGTIRFDTLTVGVPADCFVCGADACDPRYLRPWSAGPYGTGLHETADDFTVPTLDGDWSFQANWTGCESHVFVIRHPGDPGNGFIGYSQALWSSSVDALIAATPPNVHYFFLSAERDPGRVAADVSAMRVRTDSAIAGLPPAEMAHWQSHLHHVTTGAYDLGNWISAMLTARGVTAFTIDPAQSIRQVGLLYSLQRPSPDLWFLTHEVRHYNFEKERERQLSNESFTEVVLWQGELLGGSVPVDVVLPDAATMATYDTLLLDLGSECTDPWNSRSCEWDYIASLAVCDPVNQADCNEFGRWITPYGRGGRWVTDMSPYLALVASGGPRHFVYSPANTYYTRLSLKLGNRGKGVRPLEATYLYSGGGFNQDYTANHPPRTFEVPPYARRVDLAALLTGHGWGAEVENCAEFCNHQHRMTFNGTPYMREHPLAGTGYGCGQQIEDGTVPNQFGTWELGRGGWCPGLEVEPWDVDITSSMVIGGSNTVTYEGLLRGAPYVPQPSGSGQGFGAGITLNSWIVTYVESPEADCGDGLDDDGDGDVDCADQGCESQPSCAAFDTDGDGAANQDDCLALDPGLVASPAGLLRLDVTKPFAGDTGRISWASLVASAGASTRVDVLTGALGELHADRGFGRAQCLLRDGLGEALEDARTVGAVSDGFYYLLRARNRCGEADFEQPELVTASPCD